MSFLFGGSRKESVDLTAVDSDALIKVLKGLDLVMDDRIPEAVEIFDSKSTAFHLTGKAVISFIQGVLGFEPAVLKRASDELQAAEDALEKGLKTAAKYRMRTSTYPCGMEYEVCLGEVQLMHAICGFAGESIMKSFSSVLKIKRAFATFDSIMKKHGAKITEQHARPVDTTTIHEDVNVPLVDEAIQSGVLMCYGLLTLIISLLPPKLTKVLNLLGFHGERDEALKYLWIAASKPQSLQGAASFASLVQYYGGAVQLCDIYDTSAGKDGWPVEKSFQTLEQINQYYPRGKLWVLHDAKLRGMEKNLTEALAVLDRGFASEKPELQQIETLMLFEYALDCSFDHQYVKAAEYYIRVRDQNDWSHALYTYFAACCYIEDIRSNGNVDSLPKANELLESIPAMFQTKQKLFGGTKVTVPIESLIERRISKWSKKRVSAGGSGGLAEYAGPSPIMELIYVYNGYRRMDKVALTRWKSVPPAPNMDSDDEICRELMSAVVLRNLGDIAGASSILRDFCGKKIKTAEAWAVAFGYYEYAVCIWWELQDLTDNKKVREQLDECYKYLRMALDAENNELEGRLNIRCQLAKEVVKARRSQIGSKN
ncbi:Mitochondrial outer membrane protein C83.16c [Taphrina deformans PYCC 5710]|uniref:Mitochondrial outer membrane protein C83.16c n=1 Tax=Taphrina deformans (strain PYCC 5710 / ATCC 11124 / CBS 356.35 / IMI 108563 / JCM 9778 / NBRC 8474) TaxID=1097556 RepID=R4XDC1_TAPDE|nr:Mitochondrial outer membrane protein C83.16c [Taphrina deformans PYCC 5710]|eukprot:CCG82403.1 Mitochondrial outer membrane protein C83.16c [Taphrina deformans PYCC 5710]